MVGQMTADYCLKSKAIFIGNMEKLIAGSVLVKDDKILAVIQENEEETLKKYMKEDTVILDYGSKLIMPGFVDAHTHFFTGAIAFSNHVCSEIEHSKSELECAKMVADFAKNHPEEKRIRGRGWFVTNWGDAPLPTKHSLDALIPDRPVYLQAADAHSFWLNSKALEECGIKETDQVESGYIGKLEDGSLSGMLVELEACHTANENYMDFTEEERKQIYLDFLESCAKYGVTSLSEMMPDDYSEENHQKYLLVKELEQEGKLTTRLHIFPKLYDCETFEDAHNLQQELDSDYMRISGVKGFIDGVIETYTGFLLEPYTDRPDTCGEGVPVKSQEELNRSVIQANKEKLPVRIHCIADGSVRMALNAFEASILANGNHGLANTIEHVENIHPSDIPRFRKLNVIPSMQPIHLLLDANGKYARIGSERIQYEWPLRTLLAECGTLALGTDCPVVDMNPFANIYAAVARKFLDGSPAGFNPEESINMGQTLCAYTYGAAKSYGREQELGTLEKGKFADIIVIDRDLLSIPEEEILQASVEMTMIGGKIVYESP